MNACTPVTLEQMLAAREARVQRQQTALADYRHPILSISLVTPGPLKDSPDKRFLLSAALQAVDALLMESGWQSPWSQIVSGVTGPEALYVVACEATAFKHRLIRLEDEHPLGRLWDLDVICPQQGSLSRRALGAEPRRCLICGEAAHACARSRTHTLDVLGQAITRTIHGYRRLCAG